MTYALAPSLPLTTMEVSWALDMPQSEMKAHCDCVSLLRFRASSPQKG